jgi:translation elongation factor EF-G
MALEEAAGKAAPVLLEPVMRVEAIVPEVHVDAVVADLSGRRGRLRAEAASGGRCIVRAVVPLTQLLGYAAAFRSRTGGRGTYEMQFDRYVRSDPEMNSDDRTSGVGAPLKPRPKLRDSPIELPEPDDERDEI